MSGRASLEFLNQIHLGNILIIWAGLVTEVLSLEKHEPRSYVVVEMRGQLSSLLRSALLGCRATYALPH